MKLLRAVGAPWLLFGRTLHRSAREGISYRECIGQLHEIGTRSAWLVASGLAFFGVVMVLIADQQSRRLTGNLIAVGPAFFELLVREFGPLITALLAAARAGAGSSAELSAMAVSEQIEALEMSAGDPLVDLVAPRVVASAIAVPALTVVGVLAAGSSAVVITFWGFGADGFAFVDPRYIDSADVLCAAVKAVLSGIYIPLAASLRGLSARGGAAAVGQAVTTGVVDAALGCLAIDFVVALAFLLVRA